MLILDEKEFQSRIRAIIKARKIFVPHLTKNISEAFEIYQELLAEQKQQRFMGDLNTHLGVPLRMYRKYFVPRCPICNATLHLRQIKAKPGTPANFHGWKTSWFCTQGDCVYEQHSKLTPLEWMNELERKAKKHGTRRLRGIQSSRKPVHSTGSCCGGS